MNLGKYILKRIINLFLTLIIVITITWFLGRAMPGNPFIYLIRKPTIDEIAKYEEAVELHGLNEPLIVQFYMYLRNLISGNWGTSWSTRWFIEDYPVTEIIRYSFPTTFEIFMISLIISYFVGKYLAILSVTSKKKKLANIFRIMISAGGSLPIFVIGFLILRFFRFELGIEVRNIKTFNFQDPPWITGMRLFDSLISGNFDIFFDTTLHYILPVILLTFHFSTLISRQIRASMIETMQQDYIRTARAKGCTEKTVIYKHAYKVSVIPGITAIFSNVPSMIVSLILVETVLAIPGFAGLIVYSINVLDYNLMIICFALIETLVVTMNLISDILYVLLDPRIIYD